ncbi:GGDEF domain-containing protein [Synechococcales cyanobacterium CNB]|nr:GGDEF domain-containing protein [Phycisphaerales bacterium]MDL1904280.1 GGDEF domain-containing protein [Synechococcales cyanobacterium CNB]
MAPESPELRVILVGRTGLDARLRLDPGIEVIRARTPLDAIGELSDPIDDRSPSAAVVVVAPDAEPSVNGDSASRGDNLPNFLAGLRLIDPCVRVFRVGAGSPQAGLYDGVVEAGATGQTLREMLRAASSNGKTPTDDGDRERVRAESAIDPIVDALLAAGSERPVGDAPMVERLLRGGEPLAEGLALIRDRTGRADVEFIPPGAERDAAGAVALVPAGAGGAPAGALRSATATPEELRPHAAWLGLWLRLSSQLAELRQAAFRDPVTGAWNRRYFDRFLTVAIDRAREARRSLTVLVFDIDNFKQFNDKHGHGAGDEILRETVRMLTSVVRPTDRVCRIGGDEFAVIFYEPHGPRDPGSRHPASVFDIAERFQRQVHSCRFPKLAGLAPGTLTISGGLATFPWDGSTAEKLLDRADRLALESKEAGKNVITLGPGALKLRDGGSTE